jgi:protein-S-isoprenylcysteine O-methyltransferase Ste14
MKVNSMDAKAPPAAPAPAAPFSGTGVLLDLLEQLGMLALFGWLAARLLSGFLQTGELANLLLLASEGLVVFFFLIRRRTAEISRDPAEWLVALGATTAPLLAAPGGHQWFPPLAAAPALLMGLIVQLHAKLVLGRSVGLVPAHRGLRISGPYRFVRHPMYAGYLLTHVGFWALNPTAWNLSVYLLAWSCQVPRLLAEERFLGRDAAYREYRRRVRFRLLPGIF